MVAVVSAGGQNFSGGESDQLGRGLFNVATDHDVRIQGTGTHGDGRRSGYLGYVPRRDCRASSRRLLVS
ncbi:hypothetical protein D1872_328400 [compost metagenome]